MAEQMTFFDIVVEKDKKKVTPQVWECMKTCANFTNIRPDGSADYFPGTREKRCVTPKLTANKKTSDWQSELINNAWCTYCKCYKPK